MKRLSLSVAVLLGVTAVSAASLRDQKFNNKLAQLKSKQAGQCGEVEELSTLTDSDVDTITAIAADSGLSAHDTEALVALADENGLTTDDV